MEWMLSWDMGLGVSEVFPVSPLHSHGSGLSLWCQARGSLR